MNKTSLALILILSLFGCGKVEKDFELGEESFGRDTIRLIEERTGIDLPSAARGLNYYYKAPIDPGFAAKIVIPAESQADLLQRLSRIETRPFGVTGDLASKLKWWVPHGKVLIDRKEGSGDRYLHAILTEEEGRTILYLEWSVI